MAMLKSFSLSTTIVIWAFIGYLGVSDADVAVRDDDLVSNKKETGSEDRFWAQDEDSKNGHEKAWMDDSEWEAVLMRALAHPVEWNQLRMAFDKVDADLNRLKKPQETTAQNHTSNNKVESKWKFVYHRVLGAFPQNKRPIAAVSAVTTPPKKDDDNPPSGHDYYDLTPQQQAAEEIHNRHPFYDQDRLLKETSQLADDVEVTGPRTLPYRPWIRNPFYEEKSEQEQDESKVMTMTPTSQPVSVVTSWIEILFPEKAKKEADYKEHQKHGHHGQHHHHHYHHHRHRSNAAHHHSVR